MASKRQRRRKQKRRTAHRPTDFQQAMRDLLPDDAPSSLGLREIWSSPEVVAHREFYERRVEAAFPIPAKTDGLNLEPISGGIGSREAWDYLEGVHDSLIERIVDIVDTRGSAEWLFWLRRLRGQFHGMNSIRSTEPYVQSLAEALAAGQHRPSEPIVPSTTFNFAITTDLLNDLAWLSEMAKAMYRLHAVMKRCAKGQSVIFEPGKIPSWEPDQNIDDAIQDYDTRRLGETPNRFSSFGVATPPDLDLPALSSVGGLVPFWYHGARQRPGKFERADPPPTLISWVDLDLVTPLKYQAVLSKEQVALICLLWSTFNIAARSPEGIERGIATPIQWGYKVTPTENFLIPALDEICEWLDEAPGSALSGCWKPQSGREILAVLSACASSAWPPLPGSPVHKAGDLSLIDLVGASKRFFVLLERPTSGEDANKWSIRFEHDVQSVVDRSPWRPEGPLRDLIGRVLRRPDGSDLTDVDAVGYRSGRLLLISCKGIAENVLATRGDHAITRNIADKTGSAAAKWEEVVETVREDLSILGLKGEMVSAVDGCVVFPFVPFIPERRWRERRTFQSFRSLVSIGELASALEVGNVNRI